MIKDVLYECLAANTSGTELLKVLNNFYMSRVLSRTNYVDTCSHGTTAMVNRAAKD